MPAEPKTELGYAKRLVVVYGDRLRYVTAWRRWLVWDGQQWAHDASGLGPLFWRKQLRSWKVRPSRHSRYESSSIAATTR